MRSLMGWRFKVYEDGVKVLGDWCQNERMEMTYIVINNIFLTPFLSFFLFLLQATVNPSSPSPVALESIYQLSKGKTVVARWIKWFKSATFQAYIPEVLSKMQICLKRFLLTANWKEIRAVFIHGDGIK